MAETTAMVLLYAMESSETIATVEASAEALSMSVGGATMLTGTTASSMASMLGTIATAGEYASSAMTVFGGMGQAMTANQQADLQRAQFEQQQLILSAQASNAESQRLLKLQNTLSTQRAMMGAHGVDVGGGSFQALQDDTVNQSNQDAVINNLNFQQKLFQSKIGAANAALEGDAGVFAGVAKVGGGLFSPVANSARRGSVSSEPSMTSEQISKKALELLHPTP